MSAIITPPGKWITITADTQLQKGKNYIVDALSTIKLTLPVRTNVGDQIQILGVNGGYTIWQNAGQTIHYGLTDTQTGVGAGLVADDPRSVLSFVTTTRDTDFTTNSFLQTFSPFTNKPHYKTNIINGLPVARFDGIDDRLICLGQPSLAVSSQKFLFVFVVGKTQAANAANTGRGTYVSREFNAFQPPTKWVFGDNYATTGLTLRVRTDAERPSIVDEGSTHLTSFGVLTGYYEQSGDSIDYENGGVLKVRRNGVEVGSHEDGSDTMENQINGQMFLGCTAPYDDVTLGLHIPQDYLDGDIAEVIVFHTNILANVSAIEGHLMQKYGLGAGTPMLDAAILALSPKVWLKSSTLSLSDGDPITTWTDSSGNGNNFTNTNDFVTP